MNGREGSFSAHARSSRFYEWVGTRDPAHACAAFLIIIIFFMNGGPEKNLTRDCWGWLSLLQGMSFFYKEGWRLLLAFFFFLMNGGRRRLLQLAQLRAGCYPLPACKRR